MNNINKKCSGCNEKLKPSQYASNKEEGQPSVKWENDLVCVNSKCHIAEKIVD